MPTGGAVLAARVQFRVGGIVGLADIIEFLNEGLSLIEAAGSYVWDTKTVTLASSNPVNCPADLDLGKKIALFNPNGLPVRRATIDKAYSSSAAFAGIGATIYNSFILIQGSPGQFQFFPAITPIAVTCVYHATAPTLVNGGSPTVPWPYQWMDDLLVDYAEMDIKRIFSLRGTQDEQAGTRWQARLMSATKIFSSERENTGPIEEVQSAEVEKTNVGIN